MQLSNSTKGILLALLGASAWGAMGVAGQNVLQHFSFTPWDLVSLRLLCAGSILLILLFLQRGKAAPSKLERDLHRAEAECCYKYENKAFVDIFFFSTHNTISLNKKYVKNNFSRGDACSDRPAVEQFIYKCCQLFQQADHL